MSEMIQNAMRFLQRKKAGAYITVFDSPQGREVLLDLYDACGMGLPSYRVGEAVEDSLYREGRRSVLLYIMDQLHMDASSVVELDSQAVSRARDTSKRYGGEAA